MLRAVALGVASGYLAKAAQMVVSVAMVPFLIDERQLGLSGYGILATLTSFYALLTVLFDGWHLDLGRRVGIGVRDGTHTRASVYAQIAAGLAAAGAIALVVIVVSGWLQKQFLGLADVEGITWLIALSAGQLIVANVGYPHELTLYANGRAWIVNWLIAAEVVLRAVVVVAVFAVSGPSVGNYLIVLIVLLVARTVTQAGIAQRYVPAICESPTVRVADVVSEARLMVSSLPLTLQGVSAFVVFRAPVIMANRLIGSEAAAVLAIVLGTVRAYLQQLLIATLQPMLVPIAAGSRLSSLGVSDQRRLRDFLDAHVSVCLAVCIGLAIASPVWVRWWLGADGADVASLVSLGVVTVGIEVPSLVLTQMLVSQGFGRRLAVANLAAAVSAGAVMLWAISLDGSARSILLIVGGYVVVWHGLVVPRLFDVAITAALQRSKHSRVAYAVGIVCAAAGSAIAAVAMPNHLLVSGVAGVAALASCVAVSLLGYNPGHLERAARMLVSAVSRE